MRGTLRPSASEVQKARRRSIPEVNERAERMQARLERPLLVAALLTIPAIAIEQSSVGQPWDTIGSVLNWVIWLAFVGEGVLMLRVVDDGWLWLRRPARICG
jgi:hypothetical protein